MSWVTVIWATLVGGCVLLALPHLLVGIWQRRVAYLFFVLTAVCAVGAEPKRVLIVHSFGSAAPPFTVHSRAFETALVEKMGEPVDLDEVSLDMARYADREAQEGIVEYLRTRQARWQPDLVVPIGAPASIFVAEYRDRLFPKTPILYTSVDRRLLPTGALEKNAAYIGEVFDIPGLIEDMLQVAPRTKNIVVVVGATPLEQHWRDVFQRAAAPLSSRINFIYFDDLSFDQMLERAASLPRDSYIFVLLLLRDSLGVTHNADEALKRLHEVAKAPINSIFEHQLGLGIVGGRLYQSERIGREAAEVAVRILHGEPASSFPPKIIEPLPPRYDWRELQKWNIDEKSLPAGSAILYRSPTVWEQYRNWILAGLSIFAVQALLIVGLVANLIKRHRAERSLIESEKRFQSTADAAPVMIWMAGPDKLCTFFNKAWLEFTGRKMEQELGNGWSEGVHLDDFEKCLETYITAFDARKPFMLKYRLRRHDGEYRFITDSGVPRFGPRGNFRGYIGACVDVTDLLEQQKALHEFEERVTLAAEAAHLGVWELNTKTNELWMSDKARELFQFGRDALISYKEFQDRIHPEDRALRDSAVQEAKKTQSGYDLEYRALLPDGTVRWIGARARYVGDEEDAPTRLLGVSMDVTERKQAQELFQLATEASSSGTVLVDGRGLIVLVNAQTEKLFNYGRDELIGKPVEILVPERFTRHSAHREKFVAAPETRMTGAGRELFGRRKDGSEFPVEIGLNPIKTPQGILVLANVIDISARKAAEEQARKTREEIDQLTRISLLGEMTASIAHELNQPLSAILSNASAGQRFLNKGKLDPETIREILEDVGADARRAHDVIQHIRNTIKKGAAVRERINLNDVVTHVAHSIRPDAGIHSCEIETALDSSAPEVEGDPVQIQQVLINLVSNAFDAMSQTSVKERKVEITTERNGDGTVCVSVRDHGAGILPEARERLFEQFFTTKDDGLGMGLAIVRSIIETHGGRISAENVNDGGARFRFSLPVALGTTD
jgi:PAS domain S-box-containing protein